MKYFNNCKSIDDVKKTYKKLCMQLHPDMNLEKDTTKDFQEMSAEYQKAYEQYKNIFVNAEGETYEKENTETFEEYADIINKIIHFEGIKIEIIGTWIWVSGNTITYKEELKAMKFRWSNNKKSWCYHNEPYRKKSKSKLSFDEIRNFYGSSEVETERTNKIA